MHASTKILFMFVLGVIMDSGLVCLLIVTGISLLLVLACFVFERIYP